MRSLPETEIFSRFDARACGWSDPAISRAVRSGRVIRLRRDQYTAAPGAARSDPRADAIAAVRSCRGSVISHRSAALLWGLPLIGGPPRVPDVTVPPHGTGDLAGAHLYRATLRASDMTRIDGVPVTSVARTLIDIGRHRPISTAVAAMDYALHDAMATGDDLAEVLNACVNWPRVARAGRAVSLSDPKAELPLESASRLTLARLGLPAARLQAVIRDDRGVPVARSDFYWDEFGVAGEADGRSKYDRRDVLTAEKERQELLEELGLIVVRWGWADVVRYPHLLRSRVRRAFDRGRHRDRSGFPRLWSVDAG